MNVEAAGTSATIVGRSEDKENLIQELTDMGFSKSLVQEVGIEYFNVKHSTIVF